MKNPVPFTHLLNLLSGFPSRLREGCIPTVPDSPSEFSPLSPSVSEWAESRLGFRPDPLQAQILDSSSRRLILLCARQFGKSTLAAIKALHFALVRPNSTVLCVSPTLRRSTEWLRLVQHFFSILSSPASSEFPSRLREGCIPTVPISPVARGRATPFAQPKATAHSLTLPNRSRILALPGTAHSNRGYSAHLLLFEEAAFIPDPVFTALLPTVAATGGAVWLISSAGPPSGFFYEIWTQPDLPYTRFKADATQCPRITQEHLDEARLALGELRFRREYLCEFSPDALPIFSPDLLESALDDSFEPWLAEAA